MSEPAIQAVNWSLRALTILLRFARRAGLHLAAVALVASMFVHLVHVYRVQAVRSAAGRLDGALVQIESAQRLYLLTHDPTTLRKYALYRSVVSQRVLDLCHLLPANAANASLCGSLGNMIRLKLDEMQSTVDLAHAGKDEQALLVVRSQIGVEYTERIERMLDQIRMEKTNASRSGCLVL